MIFSLIVQKLGGYYLLKQKHNNSKVKIIKSVLEFVNKGFLHETNAYLPLNCKIEGPINFIHGTYGVFISGGAKIGKNCTIYQQVTIGSNMLIDSKGLGSPTIGDNCILGAGAKVIGNIKIGNNCRIGANAVVVKDLPDNSVYVLGPPIVRVKQHLENKIYQFSKRGWGYRENGNFVLEDKESKIRALEALN
ncbi:serine acetyltransferase [Pontibacter harenae]|uniref:serine acetyltransferase n=1 Tax=Pontibacter harenae TaxID=2894083 RepID=UPI001E3DEAF8|nr:serine acetyltransferase [Pontibacter harenae]MCC9166155.1 serine acetyltransferase [Pontibacter harenae]